MAPASHNAEAEGRQGSAEEPLRADAKLRGHASTVAGDRPAAAGAGVPACPEGRRRGVVHPAPAGVEGAVEGTQRDRARAGGAECARAAPSGSRRGLCMAAGDARGVGHIVLRRARADLGAVGCPLRRPRRRSGSLQVHRGLGPRLSASPRAPPRAGSPPRPDVDEVAAPRQPRRGVRGALLAELCGADLGPVR